MAYNERIFSEAEEILKKRRDGAEADAERRREEFFRECPQAEETDARMRSAVLGLVKVIGSGENAREYVEKLKNVNLKARAELEALLRKNGRPADYLAPRYVCPLCGDTGIRDGALCSCHKQLLKQLSYKELSAKSSLSQKSFDDFDLSYYTGDDRARMSRILEFCKNYARDFDQNSRSVLMTGETGLGKTHLSLAIAGAAIERGFGVVYGSVQRLISEVEREHFGRSDKPDGATEDALITCDLLILDDLGAEFTTQFVTAELNSIIGERLQTRRPTIINTNLSLAELQDKYSRRIVSRIAGEYVILKFTGRDVRSLRRG